MLPSKVSWLNRSDRSNPTRSTGDALRQLPIDKRNYLTYSLLMPGVADADALADANDYRPPQTAHSGLSFYGNNGRGNAVSVDGGEANDSGGGVRPTLSQDAVREFQVNRSNYSVELGGASGGTINIVSRSGSQALSGSVYGFFRDHRLDAADPFATKLENGSPVRMKPAAHRQQFGATLGGPLGQSRTFFFGAIEGLTRREFNAGVGAYRGIDLQSDAPTGVDSVNASPRGCRSIATGIDGHGRDENPLSHEQRRLSL